MLVENEIAKQTVSSLVRFQNKNFTTCQTLNEFFYNASDYESIFLQRVRFGIKIFTTHQILKNIFFEKHDFEGNKIYRIHDFEEKNFSKSRF